MKGIPEKILEKIKQGIIGRGIISIYLTAKVDPLGEMSYNIKTTKIYGSNEIHIGINKEHYDFIIPKFKKIIEKNDAVKYIGKRINNPNIDNIIFYVIEINRAKDNPALDQIVIFGEETKYTVFRKELKLIKSNQQIKDERKTDSNNSIQQTPNSQHPEKRFTKFALQDSSASGFHYGYF